MNKEIKNKTARIIARFLRLESSDIADRSTLTDLGADNLDKFEIIWNIEKEFNIRMLNPSAENLYNSSIKNLCKEIDAALTQKNYLFAY